MKIMFIGGLKGNAGPMNVNRSLVKNFTKEFTYLKSTNKILKLIELAIKLLCCDVVICSGLSPEFLKCANLAKKIGKKVIYLMHGCAKYENLINSGLSNAKSNRYEHEMLEKADLVLAVSERFMYWLKDYYKQYEDKFYFLNNGVEKPDYGELNYEKIKGSVIAVGGDRKIKNNETLCKAIKNMNGDAFINVCGYIHDKVNAPKDSKYVQYLGLISQKQMYQLMAQSQIFVLNSILESFSLSVIDALNCKCSILLSSAVGINGILELTDDDIIYDPNDTEEIERKIRNLMEHPNNERILAALDYDKLSYKKSVERLCGICKSLCNREQITSL